MYGSLFYVLPILAVIAKTVFRAVLPLLIGCMIAYVVNILMCFYEKGYARICRMAAIAPLQRPLCMTLSYLSLVLVILILWWMIVPQLLSCIRIIATDFPQVLELLCEWANEHLQMDLGMGNEIRAWMNEPFCWDTLIVKIPRLAKGMKTSLEKLGSWLLIFLPGLMFSFYLLAAKESLLRMGSSLIDRCFGVFQGKKIRYVLTVLNQSFHHFLAGQTIEAVILGMLCTIGMWILRLPYAAMIGCLVGVTALLPVIGAYIGAAAGACMLLTVSPVKALVFLIFLSIPVWSDIPSGCPASGYLPQSLSAVGHSVSGESCLPCHLQQPSTGCSVPQSIKAVQQAARLLKNKQKSNRAYALCVF